MKHFLQGSGGRNGENRERKQFLGGSAKRERDKRRKGMDTEKIKFSIRMDEELVRTADAYVQEGMALSRTEMIEDALRFYLGFLSAEKSEDYLCSPSRLCWEGL